MIAFLDKLLGLFASGDSRSSKMRKNSFWMLVVKGLSLLISLAYVPMMLKSVDRVEYGILLTLTSVVHWVSMMDIGLGNGLRNKLPRYLAEGKYDKAKVLTSTCYAAMTCIILVFLVVFFLVSPHLSWQGILNAPSSDESDLLSLATIVFVTFAVQFVTNLLTFVLYAYQKPAVTSILCLISQALTFIAVAVLVYGFNVSSILIIGAVTCATTPTVNIIASIILFSGKLRDVRPSLNKISASCVNDVVGLGLKFFWLQIVSVVLFQANNIIIAQVVGPESVVEYNVAHKYVGLITVLYTIIITPVWSATTDAYVRGDIAWIDKTVSYLKKVFFAIFVFGLIMVAVSKPIYRLWLGKETLTVSYWTTGLIFAYVTFDMLYKIYGTIINGVGKLFAQMVITSIIALVYIPLAIVLGMQFGLSGVLAANVFAFAGNYVWSKIQYNKISGGSTSRFWNR